MNKREKQAAKADELRTRVAYERADYWARTPGATYGQVEAPPVNQEKKA